MQLLSEGWTLRLNVVSGDEGQLALATQLADATWDTFRSSLDSNLNVWRTPGTEHIFQLPGRRLLDLAGWKDHTDQDSASTSTSAPVECELAP
jgi:hypothetical protein